MSARNLALAWRNEPIANITRAISERCDRAMALPENQQGQALHFNALLVTELSELGIWPYRGKARRR